ncbi:MAG: SusD/RagB family nutrient-binding outer membrane lipoprotein [Tenacibaculum sp.]
MKHIIYLSSLILLLCSCNFEDTNTDPKALPEVDATSILPVILLQTAYNANTLNGRAAGVWSQYYSGQSLQEADLEIYKLTPSIENDPWNNGFFGGVLKDCNLLIKLASEQNRPVVNGIAKVMMAYNLGMATAIWGDIPYSEAFQGSKNPSPSYDTQESIYNAIEKLLLDAVINLQSTANNNFPSVSTNDLIYSGNALYWLKFARSLQARFALHQIKRNEMDSLSKIQAALIAGVLQSLADEPLFKFGTSINNGHPIAVFNTRQQGRLIGNAGFAARLNSKSDPRLSKYMTLQEDGTTWAIYQASPTGNLTWGVYTSSFPFISYEEIKFIEAEYNVRVGNTNDAQIALTEAVSVNMLKNKIDGNSYIAALDSLTGNLTTDLKIVLEQKYIALFGQAMIESWTDIRRTGIPNLIPVPSDSPQNPSGIIPLRAPYPTTEQLVNADNYSQAIKRQGNGLGLLDDSMWIFD